jgi:hypothetical protein
MREKEQMTDNEIEIDVYFFLHHMRERREETTIGFLLVANDAVGSKVRRLCAPSDDFIK